MRSKTRGLGLALALSLFLAPLAAGAEPLVGPAVGDVETLVAQGNTHYNRKQYAKAADFYLQANRADPARIPTYLALARAQLAAKRQVEACNAYRAYLRAAPEAEGNKARRELELCERQLRASRKQDNTAERYAQLSSAFRSAVNEQRLLGEGGALEHLEALVAEGYVSVELGEFAAALHTTLQAAGSEVHEQALAHKRPKAAQLEEAKRQLEAAQRVGATERRGAARIAFLSGCLELERALESQRGSGAKQEAAAAALSQAERHFEAAAKGDPSVSEYKFFRAMALYRQGKAAEARESLQRDLPDDLRTGVMSAIHLLETSKELAAAEVEQLLFGHRFPKQR